MLDCSMTVRHRCCCCFCCMYLLRSYGGALRAPVSIRLFSYRASGRSGHARPAPGLRSALRCALLARLAKKNALGSPVAPWFAVFRSTWLVRALPGRSRDALGLGFRGRNDSFFDVFCFGSARCCMTSRPLRNTAWAHEFQASGFLQSSQHQAKARFERCSE